MVAVLDHTGGFISGRSIAEIILTRFFLAWVEETWRLLSNDEGFFQAFKDLADYTLCRSRFRM